MKFFWDWLAALYYGVLISIWVKLGQKTEKRARFDLLQMKISDPWVSDTTIDQELRRLIVPWGVTDPLFNRLLDQAKIKRPKVLEMILKRIREVKEKRGQ